MTINFRELSIDKNLENALEKEGIINPTPIQIKSIPEILNGKDIIAQAQTGTGKTLAFILPIIEKLDTSKPYIQALIVTPTRELAIQITDEAKKLSYVNEMNILSVYGGQDVERQIRKLKDGVHLVVGTPGRILDHLRRGTINFNQLRMLVLDEADQMLHMGFLNEIEDIISQTPKERQTTLFSATMPRDIKKIAKRYMKEPKIISVEAKNITLDEIDQIVIETTDRGKQEAICTMIDEYNPFLAIIFCRTKRRAKALNELLIKRGYNSDELHGDLSQAKRERVMKNFREAKIQLLVATDVAARGIDIEGITHVFNYDIPEDPESYIHRIGRTGRAGQTGIAITFVTPKNSQELSDIEKQIKMNIKRQKFDKKHENKFETVVSKSREKTDKSYKNQKDSERTRFGQNKKHLEVIDLVVKLNEDMKKKEKTKEVKILKISIDKMRNNL
ncbi:DEAD-box ATP-dependent RNA helicase CshA [Gottschalkia acidurici 9a]|uniref:RNA helicase n=1 Tax=Gottschalkia acidurici (strain ATCC 7906 / DSM 604 / BCRC 14475 / CIP 104303 / KCTC 5404 / NCIMB 10678 / 9a) TaxID=1128398 RepID=K0AZW0_GOTA9|nr:DEAD/DEAH box helicase [Gottschalkia acidurici]AFS79333.1 DEAD-box ATP-dependent RNA helicase CshA [Gottschalkia acidurici 9a]